MRLKINIFHFLSLGCGGWDSLLCSSKLAVIVGSITQAMTSQFDARAGSSFNVSFPSEVFFFKFLLFSRHFQGKRAGRKSSRVAPRERQGSEM